MNANVCYVIACMCHSTHIEVRGQLSRVISYFCLVETGFLVSAIQCAPGYPSRGILLPLPPIL